MGTEKKKSSGKIEKQKTKIEIRKQANTYILKYQNKEQANSHFFHHFDCVHTMEICKCSHENVSKQRTKYIYFERNQRSNTHIHTIPDNNYEIYSRV